MKRAPAVFGFSNQSFVQEKMDSISSLSPGLVAPVVAMLIPIIGIIAWAAVVITRTNSLHETVRQLIAKGQPIPPELLAKIVDDKRR